MTDLSENLTKGSLLAKNTLLSLIGSGIPIIVAIFSIPILINALGADGFGILTIAWMVTGYFSLLDLGVGRALTKMVSEKLGQNDIERIPQLIWTALMLTVLMGIIGSILISMSAETLVNNFFKIPETFHMEVERSFYILAFCVPMVICNASLSGILQSYQRFDLVNTIRIPIGSLTFLGPVFVLPFSSALSHIVIALFFVRLVELIINIIFCIRVVPKVIANIGIDKSSIRNFLSFGSWMTLSNVVGPLMLYLDRFLIGSIISISAVSYYATSYEIVHRMMIIPGAIVGVLFPAFGAVVGNNPAKAASMLFGGVKYTFISIFPLIMIIFIFAEEILNIWLGAEFAEKGTLVLKLLLIGALINSFAYFPFAVLHASGRPDLTAKLHLIETPIYLITAWILISKFGIVGAAIGWTLRALADTMILFFMAGRKLGVAYPKNHIILISLTTLILVIVSIVIPENLIFRLLITILFFLVFFILTWKVILDSNEKFFVLSHAKKFITIKPT